MSEVKRFRFVDINGYPAIMICDSVKAERFVEEQDFDRVTAELASANADKEAYAQNAIDLRKRVDALQQCLTAADELEADKRRLDLWQNNPGYFGGFAPSGDWSFFNPAGKTCYGKTLREALDRLGVMDADLKSRR